MNAILNLIKREPAIVVTVAAAVLAVAVSFGLNLTPQQDVAIGALLTVIAGVIVRSQVTPVAPKP